MPGGIESSKIDDEVYDLLERKVQPVEDRRKETDARKVLDEVFDHPTLLTIYKLICNDKLKTIDFPIATGKEGNVFKGTGTDGPVAVKIYRVSNLTFKTIGKYILGDPRFKGIEKNRRKLLNQWTQKEFRNLDRMRTSGVTVPKPLSYENNILVMEYISVGDGPAPTMKNCPPENPEDAGEAVDWVLANISACYKKARFVHGDLSEYNILCGDNGPCIIDVSQGVLLAHPMAREMLERDVYNITRYFGRLGARRDTASELRKITG
jgi:RIO kinase 1